MDKSSKYLLHIEEMRVQGQTTLPLKSTESADGAPCCVMILSESHQASECPIIPSWVHGTSQKSWSNQSESDSKAPEVESPTLNTIERTQIAYNKAHSDSQEVDYNTEYPSITVQKTGKWAT